LLGLGLAALGVFAAVAAAVAIRTRELGVRVALGAPPRSLVRLMLADAIVPLCMGIVVGAVALQGLTRLVRARIAEIEPATLGVIVAAGCLMVLVGMVAAYLPARRISRIDPIVVLRSE
jgi:ABC-type antimicrobial peptide transport system permease subunit